MRPKASWAGLICRTDQCFQRQRLPYTCWIKTVKSGCCSPKPWRLTTQRFLVTRLSAGVVDNQWKLSTLFDVLFFQLVKWLRVGHWEVSWVMDRLEDCNGLGEGHPKSFMVRSSVVVKTFFRSWDQDRDLGLQVSRPRPKPGQNELECTRDRGLEITTLAVSIPIGDRALA